MSSRPSPGLIFLSCEGSDGLDMAPSPWGSCHGLCRAAGPYVVATSTPLADDGFRQRLALDGDRLIVRVVVVDVEGGSGRRVMRPSAIKR